MTTTKEYWLWFWGVNQQDTNIHSPNKKFTDFNKMKTYSGKHGKNHKWIGKEYWSSYKKIEL